MRFDRSEHLITIQDKYLLRGFAAKRNVRMAPLLHVCDSADDIPFKKLPDNCMIKASHGCGWNILRKNGRYFYFGDGAQLGTVLSDQAPRPRQREIIRLNQHDVLRSCERWLSKTYSTKEWAYSQMRPRILIEELLVPAGKELFDYRLYTFDGEVAAINVGCPEYRRNKWNIFYRPDWTPIALTDYAEALPEPPPSKPESLPIMIDAARRLGRGIDFVRVDFYETIHGCVLGEMTVYPDAGKKNTPTSCSAFNRWLGDQWQLAPKNAFHFRLYHVVDTLARGIRRVVPAIKRRF